MGYCTHTVNEVASMRNEHAQYQDRIVRDPGVLAGKPVIRGTRISVELVLAKLAANPDVQDIFIDYPRLTMEDVQACLEYATALVAKKEQTRRPQPATVST